MEKLFDEENSTYSPLLHLRFKAWSGEENPKLLLLQLKASISSRCLMSPKSLSEVHEKACLFLITRNIFWLLSSKYSACCWVRMLSCLHKVCNALCFLATNWIGLRKLQEFDVSDNRLVELPTVFLYCFKSLNILNVSRNQLKVFPDPWACPLVSHAALSEAVKAVETVQKVCIYIWWCLWSCQML